MSSELAQELRGIRPSDVTFTTVPLASIGYITPTGESAVLWDRAQAAAALFRWLKTDAGTPRPRAGKHAHQIRPDLGAGRTRTDPVSSGPRPQDACR